MNEKSKNILLGVLIVGIISMTVAYAALSTRLSITGTASVAETKWNIHFQNWALDTDGTVTYDNNEHQNTAVYPSISQLSQTLAPNVTKVDNLNVTLKQPGDYARYTFEIINEGTIDASLANFSAPMTCASGNDCSHVSYNVKCYDNENLTGSEITTNDVLTKNGGLVYCYLEAKYVDQTNNSVAGANQVYTQSQASATLTATWQWVQNVNEDSNSGSGNSGNEQSGGGNEEPAAQTWDNYITPTQLSGGTTLPNNSIVWLQQNTSTNAMEVCETFPNDTVCLTRDPNGRQSDFQDCENYEEYTGSGTTCIKGYAKAKADEMLAKGGTKCIIYGDDWEMNCYSSDTVYCHMSYTGDVDCYYNNGYNGCQLRGYTGNYTCDW